VRAAEFPDGPVFAWLAGEASLVRSLRRHLAGERGVAKNMIAFAGYWRVDATHEEL
jgi:NADPH-dependent ferric siderophore reductase